MREKVKYLFISFIYTFRQSLKFISKQHMNFLGGNLDLFYIYAPMQILSKYKDKAFLINLMKVLSFLVLYGIIQFIFIDDINIVKMFINISKIIICYLTFLYVKDNIGKVNLLNLSFCISIMLSILVIFALIFSNSDLFWRFNDGINGYSLTRLQLFYLEPSELGFHVMPLIILFFSAFNLYKDVKMKIICVIFIFIDLVPIYLAKPLGAIAIGTVGVVSSLLYDLYLRPNKNKIFILFICFLLSCFCIYILYRVDSPIILRLLSTLQGNDASNNYRINVSFNVLRESLLDFHLLGCGFGNLHTDTFISKYTYLGLTTVLANSFVYFIIETGILGIIFVFALIYNLIRNAIYTKSIFKFGLSVFIIIYSILGGHFTSGLAWALYGILLSDLTDDDIIAK